MPVRASSVWDVVLIWQLDGEGFGRYTHGPAGRARSELAGAVIPRLTVRS
jgi:hypothetical protein